MRDKDSNSESGTVSDGEVLPPVRGDSTGVPPNIYAEITAQISQYTDRPDLLLEVIEKYDPGFIKGMNEESREFSRRSRISRFRFGRFQAYGSAIVAFLVAFSILTIILVMALDGSLTFLHLLGFGIFYAITQSGPSGFKRVIDQIVKVIKSGLGKGG